MEHPFLFYDAVHRPIQTHKLKIAYMRAVATHFVQSTKNVKSIKLIKYDEWEDVMIATFSKMKKSIKIKMFDPMDHEIADHVKALFERIGRRIEVIPLGGDLFVLDDADIASLSKRYQENRQISHSGFFRYVKAKIGKLTEVESTDAMNRKRIPRDYEIDEIPLEVAASGQLPSPSSSSSPVSRAIEDAIEYVDGHPLFRRHPGDCHLLATGLLPITRPDALEHLRAFVASKRFVDYGDYQDAMKTDHVILNHSFCSALINVGLLSPTDVLDAVWNKKNKAPINSLEGFVRQLLGWREYMRFIYVVYGRVLKRRMTMTTTTSTKKMDKKSWREGATGVLPIDVEIKKIHRWAWCHHIVRLMVFLNYMKLHDYHPMEVYGWFMEMVSLDAYEWVMVSNIMAMGHFTEGTKECPHFMRKPYVSSSAYLKRMGDYHLNQNKDKTWQKDWDEAYRAFVFRK